MRLTRSSGSERYGTLSMSRLTRTSWTSWWHGWGGSLAKSLQGSHNSKAGQIFDQLSTAHWTSQLILSAITLSCCIYTRTCTCENSLTMRPLVQRARRHQAALLISWTYAERYPTTLSTSWLPPMAPFGLRTQQQFYGERQKKGRKKDAWTCYQLVEDQRFGRRMPEKENPGGGGLGRNGPPRVEVKGNKGGGFAFFPPPKKGWGLITLFKDAGGFYSIFQNRAMISGANHFTSGQVDHDFFGEVCCPPKKIFWGFWLGAALFKLGKMVYKLTRFSICHPYAEIWEGVFLMGNFLFFKKKTNFASNWRVKNMGSRNFSSTIINNLKNHTQSKQLTTGKTNIDWWSVIYQPFPTTLMALLWPNLLG